MLKAFPKKIKKEPVPISIVCEDRKSIKLYLEDKIDALGLDSICRVEVEHDGSAPKSVVGCAIRLWVEDRQNAKKQGVPPYGEVYCVMDVDIEPPDADTRPRIPDLHGAINTLRTHYNNPKSDGCEFVSIISNDCAEVWLYLHFAYEPAPAPLDRPPSKKRMKSGSYRGRRSHRLDKLLEDHLGQKYNKSGIGLYDLLKARGGDETKAIERARNLERHHDESGSYNGMYYGNPSTEIYKLIERLNEIGGYVASSQQFRSLKPSIVKIIKDINLDATEEIFLQRLAELLDEFYASESVERRTKLLQDMLDNRGGNTACVDYPEQIGSYFYETCWERDCQQLSYIVHEIDIS